jgi:hypothetical protein
MKKIPTLPLTYNSRVQAKSPGLGVIPKEKKVKKNVSNVPVIKKHQSPSFNLPFQSSRLKSKSRPFLKEKKTLLFFKIIWFKKADKIILFFKLKTDY